jgi:Tol biopolymer transport system component
MPSRATVLTLALLLTGSPAATAASAVAEAPGPAVGTNQLVARADGAGGAQAPATSWTNGTAQVASRGGRLVAFSTESSLVPEDDNGTSDVYVRDTVAGRTTLVSTGADGPGDGPSTQPTISSGGYRVAFTTAATNLVPRDRNGAVLDVVVKDLTDGTLWLASRRDDGAQSPRASFAPVMSGDGSVVAFESAGRLASRDRDDRRDVYLHGEWGSTRLVSPGTDAPARMGDVSYDGSRIVFGNAHGVWLRDVPRFATRRLWHEPGRGTAGRPSLSADGRYAAFATARPGVVPGDRDRWSDVFRVHLPTGRVTRVSVPRRGGSAGEDSVSPSLSADGRYVAFSSWADDLAPGDGVDHDVFVRDVRAGTTYLVSRGLDGTPTGVSGGRQVAIDDSGRAVVYQTWADNIAPGDTNDTADVVLWRW